MISDNPSEQYILPNISSDQETMAKQILRGILSTPDGPTFQANIINPEIIQELLSNYDILNLDQTLFCDDALNTILGNSGQKFLGSLDAVAGTGKNVYIECSDCKVETCKEKCICIIVCRDSMRISHRRVNISQSVKYTTRSNT